MTDEVYKVNDSNWTHSWNWDW